MNIAHDLSAFILAIVCFILGYWCGKAREVGRQADIRLDYSLSPEFQSMPPVEKVGMMAFWKYIRERQ